MDYNLITAHDNLNTIIKQFYEGTKPTALQKEAGRYFSVTGKETSLIFSQIFAPTIVSKFSKINWKKVPKGRGWVEAGKGG